MTQRDEGHKSIVWKISITTKYGTDVILINQPTVQIWMISQINVHG